MNIDRFVELRRKKNMSQGDLCKGICTQATLSRFENQGKVPNLNILIQLCRKIDMSLDELFPTDSSLHLNIEKSMEKIEFLLVLREYKDAGTKLNEIEIDKESINDNNLLAHYYYLEGFCSIYNDLETTNTLFLFDQILLLEDIDDIYKLLAYTGIGVAYADIGEYLKAEGYFNKAFDKIFEYKMKTTEDIWRILTIVYNCGNFYSKMGDLETSNSLLNYALKVCQDNHVTYYVARIFYTLSQNAIQKEESTLVIKDYVQKTAVFAEFNRNKILLKELNELSKKYT